MLSTQYGSHVQIITTDPSLIATVLGSQVYESTKMYPNDPCICPSVLLDCPSAQRSVGLEPGAQLLVG